MVPDDADADPNEPRPPASLPKYLVDGCQKQDAETLRDLAAYAEALAEHQEIEAERELQEDGSDPEETPDEWDDDEYEDALDEAMDKADLDGLTSVSRTKKTIDGRDYYYLQWREGDKIVSQYLAPVQPAD